MHVKLFLLTLLISHSAVANFSCHLTQQFGDPKIASNAKFWDKFGKIAARGDDRELVELFKEFEIDARVASKPVVVERRIPTSHGQAYQMNHKAINGLKSLQPALREKADEFLGLAKNGSSELLSKLRANPGRWKLKHLTGDQSGILSARLNDGYRVLFKERADHSIEIINFSKTASHGGH